MTAHGYETGRLNLPFVGIATFGKRPYVEDWSKIDADAAILGDVLLLAPGVIALGVGDRPCRSLRSRG